MSAITAEVPSVPRPTTRNAALLPWLAFATISVVWGSTYFGIAVALRSFTPLGLVSVRFALSAIVCFALGRFLNEPYPDRRTVPHALLVGLLLLGVGNTLVSWAELHVPSGLAAVLCAPIPVYIALLSLRTDPLGGRGWAGALLGTAGVVLLMAPWEGAAPGHVAGVVAIVVGNVAWAAGTIHGRRFVKSGGLLTNASLQMGVASLAAFLLTPLGGGLLSGPVRPDATLALVYLALAGSCLAFTAYVWLTRVWSPARAGTYAYLNPLVAVALGAIFLGEPFGLRTLAGMAVILAGVALVQTRQAR